MKLYLIMLGADLVDGELRNHDDTVGYLAYCDDIADLKVHEFDFDELNRDKSTTIHDVTEEMVLEAWTAGNLHHESRLAWAHGLNRGAA